jgi:hypothetical protein
MRIPINKKAPVPTKTQNAFITKTDSHDYPTALPSSKALLKAHLAQTGYLVHDVADGYLVVRADWGLSRHCDSLADLQAFAKKVGVSQ